jgi:PmbA protein
MLEKFIDSFTSQAKSVGITHLEFYIKECEGQTVQVYKEEVERLNLSQETLVYIEGEYEGYTGSTFVESIGTARINEHLEAIRQTALYNRVAFKPRSMSSVSNTAARSVQDFPSPENVTEWLKEAEQRAYDYDSRVDNVGMTSHTTHRERIILVGDQGNRLEDLVQFDQVRMSLVARDGAMVQSAFESRVGQSLGPDHVRTLAHQAAEKVVSQLEASPVKTGPYAVILHNHLVCELVLAFLPALYGDRALKKMSVLAGKVGKTIASPLFSLVEDPRWSSGIVTRSFDDEGTATQRKAIIEQGRLTTLLHNRETSQAFQVQSTGNGFKNLYREPPAVSATNLHIPGGTHTLPELIKEMHKGLLITNCDGIFAGANPVSGDFSLIAKGYLVEGGAIQRAVNQITIGGNYYDMLNQLALLGSEQATGGSLGGCIQAPSLLVQQLFVSGT